MAPGLRRLLVGLLLLIVPVSAAAGRRGFGVGEFGGGARARRGFWVGLWLGVARVGGGAPAIPPGGWAGGEGLQVPPPVAGPQARPVGPTISLPSTVAPPGAES